MNFYNYDFDEQLIIIDNSYEYAKKSFPLIEEDIKIELMSYAEVECKFDDIRKEVLLIQNNIKECLVEFNNNRSIGQAKKNYWSIFKAFDVVEIEDKLISEKFILIFQNTYYCMLYFKIIKFYEKDILKSAKFIIFALRGSIIEKDSERVCVMLLKLDDMISLPKSSENHFFFQSLSIYGTMGMNKNKVLQGFVDKMRKVLSAKRETISDNINKLPNISMEKYINKIKKDYSIS